MLSNLKIQLTNEGVIVHIITIIHEVPISIQLLCFGLQLFLIHRNEGRLGFISCRRWRHSSPVMSIIPALHPGVLHIGWSGQWSVIKSEPFSALSLPGCFWTRSARSGGCFIRSKMAWGVNVARGCTSTSTVTTRGQRSLRLPVAFTTFAGALFRFCGTTGAFTGAISMVTTSISIVIFLAGMPI